MPAVCLPKAAVDKFRSGFQDGSLDPEKLASMSSDERHALFNKLIGEDGAKLVNSNFESKLLLKNQQKGMVTWAKSLMGLKPEVKRDLITKISRLDKVLDPEDKQAFLKDLASTKLGVNVTQDEAKTIADLSKKVETARVAMKDGGDRLTFGRAQVELSNYVSNLKLEANKMSLADAKRHPGEALKLGIETIASNAKAINASFDNSGLFRPGLKTMFTHPSIWAKNAVASIKGAIKAYGSNAVIDELHADILSRPNYLNGRMTKAGLDISRIEEAFPTTAPEKIPFLGKLYRSSEAAFTILQQRNRADVFDRLIEVAENKGINLNNVKELKSRGMLANSLTGRGSLGSFEKVGGHINVLMFSPKMLKSNIDTLTAHSFRLPGEAKLTASAKKEAVKNTLEIVTGVASILGAANALKPGSVELDPRSSDFGKIKIGHTRFDVSGGMASIVTLAARELTQSSKSTTTGQVNKLNSGKVGAQTGTDVFNNFFENKLSPMASVVKDLLNHKDYNGNPVTIGGEAKNLFTPLGVKNYQELKSDPKSANNLVAMMADALGIATNTYGANFGGKSPWESSDSKELTQFKQKVGADKFKQASDQYNTQLNKFMDSITQDKDYQRKSADEQKKAITFGKDEIQLNIFKKNNFKYKQDKQTKTDSSQLKKFTQKFLQ